MIIILKNGAAQNEVNSLISIVRSEGVDVHSIVGESTTILGLVGDTSKVDIELIEQSEIVDAVRRVSEPYKLVNRKFHSDDSCVRIGENAQIGAGVFGVIAGPCSVESEEQIIDVAKRVKAAGGSFLRGGAFKPRTSPYAFRGLKAEGLRLLLEAKKATGLPIVTELTSLENIDLFADVDVIQVGARNMQNFDMLWELGKSNKPILLKRGLSSSIEELLMSAEYIAAGGNENIILCERGIRTFERATRNTLDLASIPLLKQKTHLPIVVDPSHATGIASLVRPMAKAAMVCGADGLMVEVHNNPSCALCDGQQSITPDAFDEIMSDMTALAKFECKTITA